jgi:hypothetical protein
MAVLMADRSLSVRHRSPGTLDSHGDVVGGAWGAVQGPWPGRAHEGPNGAWTLAVDEAAWPVLAGDIIVQPDNGRQWIATTAQLMQNNLDSSVNYVRVDALERVGTNTEPPMTPTPTTRAG